MPNIASVLREEITRLARKEVRAQTAATRRASAQHRRDIAQLKRKVESLTKKVAFLERQQTRRDRTSAEAAPKGSRFSARGLKTHRTKLGLSAADYGDLVGVSAQTVYSWEQEKSRPRDRQLAAIVAIRELGKREARQRLDLLHRPA